VLQTRGRIDGVEVAEIIEAAAASETEPTCTIKIEQA
jgi:hypothetical protein